MKLRELVPALLLFLCVSIFAGEDDWLGLEEKKYHLHLNYGMDYRGNSDESLAGLGFAFPGPLYSEINLTWAEYEVANETLEGKTQETLKNYSVGWNSDAYARWSVEFKHHYTGKPGAVEVSSNQMAFFFNTDRWRVGAQLSEGEIKGYRNEAILERFNIPAVARVERSGSAVNFSYSGSYRDSEWRGLLYYENYSYNRDLSNVLNSRLFLLNFNDAVIGQVLLLNNWNLGVRVQKKINRFDFNIGLEYFEEVVNRNKNTQYVVGAGFPINDNLSLDLDYFTFAEDANDIVNLSLKLSW